MNLLKYIPILLDILIVIMLIFAFKRGYKKGLVQIVLELAAVFLIIPIAMLFAIPIANTVYTNTPAIANLEKHVEKTAVELIPKEEINKANTELKFNKETPRIITNIVNNTIKEHKNKAQEEIAKEVAKNITRLAIQALFVFIFYILLTATIYIFKGTIIKIVDMIPIINSVNGLAGSILEIIKILAILFIGLYLVKVYLGATINKPVEESIKNSIITNTLYNNNVIDYLVK